MLGKEGKNLYAGTGLPEICIPMTADSREALAASARNIRDASCADAAEWRADWFSGNLSEQTVRAETAELKNILADKPLIFTIRSTGEGGKADYSADQFVHLAAAAAEAGADLVDCELSRGEEAVRQTRVCVRRAGAELILSRHFFSETPADDRMEEILFVMNRLGADFAKLAVMPKDFSDVCRLMAVTEKVHRALPDQRLITMSMGKTGMISRVTGALTGSVLTFGTLGAESAPGQPDAWRLRAAMEKLREAGI